MSKLKNICKSCKDSYKDTFEIFQYYWKIYGGYKALLRSPYLHIAILLLILTHHYWLHQGWWEHSLTILPSLLGFSLGGFAIFLGFGDEQFRAILTEKMESKEYSFYTLVSSTFVHFIIVQSLGIIFALLAQALFFIPEWFSPECLRKFVYITPIFWGIGYLLLLYSITSMLAVVMAIFRCARLYENIQSIKEINESKNQI